MIKMKRLAAAALVLLMLFPACAEDMLKMLPMSKYTGGPEPKYENCIFAENDGDFQTEQTINGLKFVSAKAYKDDSISVEIHTGRSFDTDYTYAHVKIINASQLRSASATASSFTSTQVNTVREIAKNVNAVVAINGDFHAKPEKCKVLLRQSRQVRNSAQGDTDLLLIDKNGDFSILDKPTRQGYASYYKNHEGEMYQVYCFGPVLIRDGEISIGEKFRDNYRGSDKNAQRCAVAQLGPLEYMLITCASSQTRHNKGMTLQEFAQVCLEAGKELNPEGGCSIAYNLDGGNSATLVFLGYNTKIKKIRQMKINPGQERQISDILYFATLVN